MKQRIVVLFTFLLALVLTSCDQKGVYSGKIVLGGSLTISPGQVETADILLIDGSVTIAEGGRLFGNIFQFQGDLKIYGVVAGDVQQFGGRMELGPAARVEGNLMGDPLFPGDIEELVGGDMVSTEKTESLGEDSQQPVPSMLLWQLAITAGISLLAFGLGSAFPAHLRNISQSFGRHTVVSLAMGILAGIVGLSLLVQMAFTIILIPVALLGLFALAVSVLVGWIGLGSLIGSMLSQRLGTVWSDGLSAALGTLLITTALQVVNQIPVIGGTLSLLLMVTALGAVFLTRFGWKEFIPARIE